MAPITITEYTDPFCTWCWGSEPILKHLQERYRDQIEIRFIMGGLIDDFESFSDPGHDITDPADVAPHWEEASKHHGMPVDTGIWTGDDPPQSTYPANRAYKAAQQQGETIANRYLRRMREAVATEQQNIAKRAVLVRLAEAVGLDTGTFERDLDADTTKQALQDDLEDTRDNGVTGFPTYRIETAQDQTWLQGYRGFHWFEDVFDEFSVSLTAYDPPELPTFVEQYGKVTTQEVAEVYGLGKPGARTMLEELAADGSVEEIPRGNGSFWTAR